MKFKDRTGKKYGKLTVIKYLENQKWLCKCECGKEKIVHSKHLIPGVTKSCGCMLGRGRSINFLGMRRKFLVCTKKISDTEWEWTCDCGNKVILKAPQLYHQKTCGLKCSKLKNEQGASHRKPQQRTINAAYQAHKCNQNTRDKGFLSRQEWKSLVFQPCYYCGEIDTRNYSNCKTYRNNCKNTLTPEIIEQYNVKINGVDRIDSLKPYTLDNCVPCCSHCNVIKMDYTLNEFFEKIKKIYEKNIQKKQ